MGQERSCTPIGYDCLVRQPRSHGGLHPLLSLLHLRQRKVMPAGDGQEAQRIVYFFLILFFIYLQPDNSSRQRIQFGDAGGYWDDQRERDFDVLANTTYGDFGPDKSLNLTGFRENDGHFWDVLPDVQALSRQQYKTNWGNFVGSYYDDITGDVRGDFGRSGLSVSRPSAINLTALDPRKDYILDYFHRNITEDEGEISITFTPEDDAAGKARALTAELSIWAESAPGTGWVTTLQGVHLATGGAVLTTSSSKFDALPALPHFALNAEAFTASVPIMNQTVVKSWDNMFMRDTDFLGVARCEIVVWLQPKPLPGSPEYIHLIESELTSPQGAPIGDPPPLSFSAVLFSPDCGWVLEANNLTGAKVEVFTKLSNRLLFAYMILVALQINLLKRQMKHSSTPSTRSRIAYQSITLAALGDGLIIFVTITLLTINDGSHLLVAAVIFLSIIHTAFLEVKFVFHLWSVQVGEPQNAEAERLRRDYLQRRTAMVEEAQRTQRVQRQEQTNEVSTTVPGAYPTTNATATEDTPTTQPAPPSAPAAPPLPAQRADTGAAAIPVFIPSDQDDPVTISNLPASFPLGTAPETRPLANILPSTNPLASLTYTQLIALGPPPQPATSFLTIYARFYFFLALLLIFSLISTSFPRPLRAVYFNLLATVYLSLWLPQIYRNVQRNCRKALGWEYVILGSVCRATPVLYWYFAKGNLLAVKTSPRVAVFLIMWLAVQVAVLVSQRLWGARWFLFGMGTVGEWLPVVWEYHPTLTSGGEDEESAGADADVALLPGKQKASGEMSVNLLASAGEAKDEEGEKGTRRVFDCAICMNEIDVPVVQRGDAETGKGKGLGLSAAAGFGLGLERAGYMVTPCRHIFHAECLEGWMGLRLVCPVCREGLPPL